MNPQVEQRLSEEGLSERIAGAAYNVARQYGVEPADVEQEIVLAILEQYTKDPDFLNQTDAYIVNKGAWVARSVLKRMAVQEWNHEVDDAEAETGISLLDLAGGCDPWATVDLELALDRVYDELGELDRGIMYGLYEGMTYREIGTKVERSHQTVCNHVPVIAQAIRAHR